MLSGIFISILPFIIALIGGIMVGTIYRKLALRLTRNMGLEVHESHEIVLLSTRNLCIIFMIVLAILPFLKYGYSVQSLVIAVYFIFLLSSLLWGTFMGLTQKFTAPRDAMRILAKL